MQSNEIQTAFARFKIWAGNLGALQRGSGSLDVRLRESSVIRISILRTLNSLQKTLKESNEVISGHRLPYEKQPQPLDGDDSLDDETFDENDSGSESNMTELEMRSQSLQYLLRDLYRLLFTIRNTTSRGNSSKALSFTQYDRETGVNIFSVYETFDRRHLYEHMSHIRKQQKVEANIPIRIESNETANTNWPDLDERLVGTLTKHPLDEFWAANDFLTLRLASANTRRRQHFAYWQRHALKLTKDHDIEFHPETSESSRKPPLHKLPLSGQAKFSLSPFDQIAPTIISGTEATRFDPVNEDNLDTATVISYATTAYGPGGNSVELPSPPSYTPAHHEFLCPLCHVVCPSKYAKNKEWRAHVLHDLQPYICTYPECATAETLYSSRLSWLEHERKIHRRVWQCHEHAACIYHSKETFQKHLNDEHDNLTETNAQQLASFAEATLSDERDVCPFCLVPGPFPSGLHNHLAFHQEQIAAFSLPRNIHGQDDGGSKSSPAQGIRSRNSLGSVSLGFNHSANVSIVSSRPSSAIPNMSKVMREELDELNATSNKGIKLENEGKLAEAEKMLQEALQLSRKIFGDDHLTTLRHMRNLAKTFECQFRDTDAEKIFREILATSKKLLGEDHPETLGYTRDLANTLRRQSKDKINEAGTLLESIIKSMRMIITKEYLADDPNWVNSHCLLAGVYGQLSWSQKAIELLKPIVKDQENILAENDLVRLKTQFELAHAYYSNREYREAVELLEHVVKLQGTVLDEIDNDRMKSENLLVDAYHGTGQANELRELLESIVAVREKKLKEENYMLLHLQEDLAMAYINYGQMEKALRLYEHVVAVRKSFLKMDEPPLLNSQRNLAEIYKVVGQVEKAQELLEHVVAMYKNMAGGHGIVLLDVQGTLALAYREGGHIKKAIGVLEDAVARCKNTLQLSDLSLLRAQETLAGLYQEDGQTEKALDLQQRVVAFRQNPGQPVDHSLWNSQESLARLYQANGQEEKAAKLREDVAAMRQGTEFP